MTPYVLGALFAGIVIGTIFPFVILRRATREWQRLSTINAENRQAHESLTASREAMQRETARSQETLNVLREGVQRLQEELDLRARKLDERANTLESAVVSYDELKNENQILKRDLRNYNNSVRKLQLDRDAQAREQVQLDLKGAELAQRYLSEFEKWVGASINANNYSACKQRLVKVIEACREIGYAVPREREEQLLRDLKADYERAVRIAIEREEQARIKAQIREEQKREREIEKELEALNRERAAIRAALERALADAKGAHAEEVETLKARLAESEERNQRAIARAQMTKAGHIYIVSNIGAFGDGVFKIGMTRRLEPLDRISELGDASVPFPFDVHMMISCDDAPALEYALHKEFHRHRVNRVNFRKEFFRIDLEAIRRFVESSHGEIRHIADPEALEYRQSQTISLEDEQYIKQVFEDAEKQIGAQLVED